MKLVDIKKNGASNSYVPTILKSTTTNKAPGMTVGHEDISLGFNTMKQP